MYNDPIEIRINLIRYITLFKGGKKMKTRHAFTLIELLVVIAVIAILLAILMPALRAAKDQAKKTVCTSHIKGLVLAMKMYVDDYDGKTHDSPNNGLWDNAWEHPTIVKEYGPNDSYAYWGIAYFPYAKNKKIFYCPRQEACGRLAGMGRPLGTVVSAILQVLFLWPQRLYHEQKDQS